MGLFKPIWMGNNKEKALQAVEALTDQSELALAAKEARHTDARKAAIQKLTDIAALSDIISDEITYYEVKREAERRREILERLIKQEKIEQQDSEILQVLVRTTDPDEGREAFRRILDTNRQLGALKSIHDQQVLIAVLRNEIRFDIKMKKTNVRAAIKNAIESINDRETVIDLFENARSYCVRVVAMELIADQSVLVRVLRLNEEKIKKEHLLYSQKDELALFCTAIVDKITDIEYLVDIAEHSSSYEDRMLAVKTLSDSGLMLEYILPVEPIAAANEYCNTAGNINNGGYAASQGDRIFYSNREHSGFLYKIRIDGTEKEQINNDTSSGVNVVGEWAYYRNESDNDHLYKIRINGTGRTQLNSNASLGSVVAGDWIYYKNNSAGNSIYKIRTDGSGEKKLIDIDDCSYFNVAGERIYFTVEDYDTLYSADLNGSNITRILYNCSAINIIGDRIYYLSRSNNIHQLCRRRTDVTGEMRVTPDDCLFINVVGDWIYYRNQSGRENSLYKIRTNGTGKIKLSGDDAYDINVAGNWIYYRNHGDENRFYRIRTNGAERQLVN